MNQQIVSELKQVLDLSLFGQGQAKDFADLIQEIALGESQIQWLEGKPVRVLNLVSIKIFNPDGRSLYEDRQVFTDGRVRYRGIWGVSEKLFPGEEPNTACDRALYEELGYTEAELAHIPVNFVSYNEEWRQSSPSYPGLRSHYRKHNYTAYIPSHLVKPEYVEIQAKKRTYFVWR